MQRRNFQYLKEHILPLSESSDFNIAKLEWELDYVVVSIDFGQCPCTQPIKEHCYLRNKINKNTTHVGNICVKRFMEIDASNVFSALRRIQKDRKSKPNHDLIEYAMKKGYLYDYKDYNFLQNIKNKRNLSEGQLRWLGFINRRIVEGIVVQHLSDAAPAHGGNEHGGNENGEYVEEDYEPETEEENETSEDETIIDEEEEEEEEEETDDDYQLD